MGGFIRNNPAASPQASKCAGKVDAGRCDRLYEKAGQCRPVYRCGLYWRGRAGEPGIYGVRFPAQIHDQGHFGPERRTVLRRVPRNHAGLFRAAVVFVFSQYPQKTAAPGSRHDVPRALRAAVPGQGRTAGRNRAARAGLQPYGLRASGQPPAGARRRGACAKT